MLFNIIINFQQLIWNGKIISPLPGTFIFALCCLFVSKIVTFLVTRCSLRACKKSLIKMQAFHHNTLTEPIVIDFFLFSRRFSRLDFALEHIERRIFYMCVCWEQTSIKGAAWFSSGIVWGPSGNNAVLQLRALEVCFVPRAWANATPVTLKDVSLLIVNWQWLMMAMREWEKATAAVFLISYSTEPVIFYFSPVFLSNCLYSPNIFYSSNSRHRAVFVYKCAW